jgi:cell filamentation protein
MVLFLPLQKFIPRLMKEFSLSLLESNTPLHSMPVKTLALLLVKIHTEFIIIHPFREGNGRTIRLLLSLIAHQAGYAGMDFSFIKEKGKEFKKYIKAIQAGIKGDYFPMTNIMEKALSR